MPESSPPGSVLRWPSAPQVLEEARRWAERQHRHNPDVLAVGVFGSYGRGDAGVGSDLDLGRATHLAREPNQTTAPIQVRRGAQPHADGIQIAMEGVSVWFLDFNMKKGMKG
jgi:hypothetical protein